MKSTPHPRMIPSTLAARCASAAGRLLPVPPGMFRSLTLILAFAATAVVAPAVTTPNIIPSAAQSDPLFAKGYLNVKHYGVVKNSIGAAAANTTKINQALADAYNFDNLQTKLNASTFLQGSLVLFFEPGTYYVNNTLQAWTATSRHTQSPGHTFATPTNHLVVIGGGFGANRPKIVLVDSASGFGSSKVLFEFKNFARKAIYTDPPTNSIYDHDEIDLANEDPSTGYRQMLRDIDLDCGNGNPGAIALYFNQAQDSSVENVSIDATGASTGIKGLPGRGWGAVNISVTGGDYGIDFLDTAPAGPTVAGLTLIDQKVNAVRFQGFSPLTIVGFSISAPASQANAAIEVVGPNPTNEYENIMNLVDGQIQMNNTNAAAIENQVGATLYMRNVYVRGTKHMVREISGDKDSSATANPAKWSRINEYCWNNPVAGEIDGNDADKVDDNPPLFQNTRQSVNGAFSAAQPTPSFTPNTSTTEPVPPGNIVTKHVWGKLPAVYDADAYDPVATGQIAINATTGIATAVGGGSLSAKLNTILSANNKVFLPKGIYRLESTVTIPSNKILFGAARHLTRIEVKQAPGAWIPTAETAMITTQDDVEKTATTYFGDITIGVDTFDTQIDDGNPNTIDSNDLFVALWWMAGGNSMVHMGQPYRWPTNNNEADPTRDHSLIKITGNGGGRWYFLGSSKAGKANHPGFRILEVAGVSNADRRDEPLWIYGLNPEHPRGPDHYVEFKWTDNVRIYGGKTEYSTDPAFMGESSVVNFSFCDNIALYGMGAIRNGLKASRGNIEFFDCTNVLATALNPQRDDTEYVGAKTLLEKTGGTATRSLASPHIVSMYRNGDPTETLMKHIYTSY